MLLFHFENCPPFLNLLPPHTLYNISLHPLLELIPPPYFFCRQSWVNFLLRPQLASELFCELVCGRPIFSHDRLTIWKGSFELHSTVAIFEDISKNQESFLFKAQNDHLSKQCSFLCTRNYSSRTHSPTVECKFFWWLIALEANVEILWFPKDVTIIVGDGSIQVNMSSFMFYFFLQLQSVCLAFLPWVCLIWLDPSFLSCLYTRIIGCDGVP